MPRPQSTQYGLPLFLEDLTGSIAQTSFSDLYDRLNITLTPTPASRPEAGYLQLGIRMSTGRPASPDVPDCVIDLPHIKQWDAARVRYCGAQVMPVESYLRKVKGSSSRSSSRWFTASDGHSYTWALTMDRATGSASWTCTNSRGGVVAEYTANDPGVTGSKCAAVLTIEEAWNSIALEILTTLLIVRHMDANKL